MQYYRCKCVNAKAWGSMGPAPCTRCSKCGSDLALGPGGHQEPEPHEFVTSYETSTGAPYEVCKLCMRRRTELSQDGESVSRLRTVRDVDYNLYGYRFDCPGCGDPHVIPTTGAKAWGFNGNVDKPTFTPSILVRWRASDPTDKDARVVEIACHSFVTDGRIQFLSDCSHALAGQTVDLPDIPTTLEVEMTDQHEPEAPGLQPTNNPVRDLADVIRAIALAHAAGYPIEQALSQGLALANRLDPPTM